MSSEPSSASPHFSFVCPLSSGMHARPASELAGVANNFTSECALTNLRNRRVANAKSVLSIIAADIRHGDHCVVRLSGADEQSARANLNRFVAEVLPGCDVSLAESAHPNRNSLPRVLQAAGVSCCFGAPAGPGIAHGKVVVVSAMSLPVGLEAETAGSAAEELERIKRATSAVRERIRQKLKSSGTRLSEAVLQADLAMADDVLFAEKLAEEVAKGKSAGYAVLETGEFFINLLRRSENEYIRERASDIEEISVQLLDSIYGTDFQEKVVRLQEPSIVVAETLGPQQLLALDRRWLKAIVLEHSGANSHALILARSHCIPAVVGIKNARLTLSPGQEVLVDANRGFVTLDFSAPVQRFYAREQRALEQRRVLRSNDAGAPVISKDAGTFEVAASASSREGLKLAFENGADGIGLFRTEMNFLERERPPSEDEEFEIYAQAARLSGGRPVIIRTVDLGGDKPARYLNLPREDNPFLGYRGARIYAEHRELLQTQLRAILRASIYGRLQIMAPMISALQEVLRFKAEIATAKGYLELQKIPFQADTPIGIMVEVPSVAFILDQLCTEVDFFSIGTNDLAQYFFAAARDNPRVTELSNVLHPGFLRFLKRIVDDIHAGKKWVGMCGEMASELLHLPLLLGLGLDEISITASKIPEFKGKVQGLSRADCERLLAQALACHDAAEVRHLCTSMVPMPAAQPLLTEDLVLLKSESRNKEEAIQEVVNMFYVAGRTENREQLEEALWAREAVYSTGLGFGFATPHCKTNAVTASSIGILKLQEPVDWGAVDGQPVRMVILITMQDSSTGRDHMHVFSTLARKLMDEGFRNQMLAIDDSHKMVRFLDDQFDASAP